jgi:primosomal protein N' (replication factor Y) (superfamily II helicase)
VHGAGGGVAAARFAEVAALVPVHGVFHYQVPERLRGLSLVGSRVLVPFGNRGVTGVVTALSDQAPAGIERIRAIDRLLDDQPQVGSELLELCLWIADYYEAFPGEVLKAALPVGTVVAAEQHVELTEAGREALAGAGAALTRKQRDLLGALAEAGGEQLQGRLLKSARARLADVADLVEGGLARYLRVAGRARMQARRERWAVLARPLTDDDRAALSRAIRRRAVLEALERAGGQAPVAALREDEPRAAAHLRELEKAGLVGFEERRVRPGASGAGQGMGVSAPVTPPTLTGPQTAALAAIEAGMAAGFAAYLLHGITGSGKTEVYLHAIAEVLEAGKSAVVLVPEISLTPQLAARFRARFGDRVAILHSGLTDRERYDEWQRLRAGSARIALGARSAVFAPVTELGIIVVDEEHDSSFKQEDGVRYNARDVALVRAQRAGAVCVLGSATPSMESFHAAETGRYQRLVLPTRATAGTLPAVEVVDMRTYKPETEAMLTAPLATAIEETVARGEQIILFLNRRGFATFVLCRACGHAFRCEHCSVSLTYHRGADLLKCHYCGYQRRVPDDCPSCAASGTIVRKGLGTEKVAEAVAERFPGARVDRLDRDVATGAKVEAVLGRVARRQVDILVGTQMVTKGHDFPGVTLVGVLCADTGLSLPDFRASERTFQLLTQVAGRAGRGDRAGRVLVQTFRPDSVAVTAAAAHDYERFYAAERAAREELGYPPFGHLVALRIDGRDPAAVQRTARELARRAERLRAAGAEVSLLGPAEAPLARLKGRTRWHLWLRAPERRSLRRMVRVLTRADDLVPPGVRLGVDVDPISAL